MEDSIEDGIQEARKIETFIGERGQRLGLGSASGATHEKSYGMRVSKHAGLYAIVKHNFFQAKSKIPEHRHFFRSSSCLFRSSCDEPQCMYIPSSYDLSSYPCGCSFPLCSCGAETQADGNVDRGSATFTDRGEEAQVSVLHGCNCQALV